MLQKSILTKKQIIHEIKSMINLERGELFIEFLNFTK